MRISIIHPFLVLREGGCEWRAWPGGVFMALCYKCVLTLLLLALRLEYRNTKQKKKQSDKRNKDLDRNNKSELKNPNRK